MRALTSSRFHLSIALCALGLALHVRGDEPPPPRRAVPTDDRAANKLAAEKPGAARTPRPVVAGSRTFLVAIEGDIDLGLAPYVERVLAEVGENDTVLFRVNTFGGRIDAAVRIRDAILNTHAYTIGFVDKRAISAGALITLATDTIVMGSGATIGAATPVTIEGGKMQPVEQKVVSYMRKEMKATAEAKGRRGDIAEAMVDAQVVIDGLDGKDTTLTLTTDEAIKFKVASLQADTIAALCNALGRPEPNDLRPGLNWAERVARFLSDAEVSSLLMTLGMLGIMVEVWAPGHAVAGALGVLCLMLFFFGQYVVHLAGWGEILLFLVGAAAVGIEVVAWPGHGMLAVGGALAIVCALVMALLDTQTVPLDVSLSLGWVTRALSRVLGSLMATAALMVVATRFLPKTRFGRALILKTAITAQAGAAWSQSAELGEMVVVGETGLAETTLRPAGKVRIAERRWDVVTDGEFVEAGAEIVVVSVDRARIVVRRRS